MTKLQCTVLAMCPESSIEQLLAEHCNCETVQHKTTQLAKLLHEVYLVSYDYGALASCAFSLASTNLFTTSDIVAEQLNDY